MTATDPAHHLLLTPDEAAAALGTSPAQLRRWRARQQGPQFYDLGRGLIRYSRASIDAAAAELRAQRAETMRVADREDETSTGDHANARSADEDRTDG